MISKTPILFIVYNRPDLTARVFEKIKEIKPEVFYVAADGPRKTREGENEKCETVRKLILDGVDWPCDLQLKFSDENFGCGKAVSSALIWFFKNVGEGIVLEDDTLPDPSFFSFCTELLAQYRNDESVRMIGGNNFQNGKAWGDGSYYFSEYTHSWGFASWWRAWKDYDFTLSDMNDSSFEELLEKRFSNLEEKNYWRNIYKNFRSGHYDTWDFQFLFKMWEKNGKCIIPNKNLVSNIGFGNNATHTTNINDPASKKSLQQISKIIHPTTRDISKKADRFFFTSYLKGENVFQRKIKNAMKKFFKIK